MCFTGNPGSAKTTVARLLAQILRDHKVLANGHIIECGRADLVGKYVGHTAPIIKHRFIQARGGILFIDEAYSLVDDKDGMYGDEAINTIVQEMENSRNDVIVVFAGYPDKMEGFLNKNPGLRSRIAFHVPFADYNAEELYAITELLAKKSELTLSGNVKSKLIPLYERACQSNDFGNGRFARTMLEKATMRQASRLVAGDIDFLSSADLAVLYADDFVLEENAISAKAHRRIGF
jgi:AAA+ superfamily predicted ATPase